MDIPEATVFAVAFSPPPPSYAEATQNSEPVTPPPTYGEAGESQVCCSSATLLSFHSDPSKQIVCQCYSLCITCMRLWVQSPASPCGCSVLVLRLMLWCTD